MILLFPKAQFPKIQWTPVFLGILGFTGQLMDDDGWIMAVSEIHKKCSLSIVLSLSVQILATEALNILPKILRRYGWSFWVCQTIP